MSASIFWYDYETTGINPRSDRPLQVAGIRTDEQLNEIEAPVNLYCRPSDDILPHPAACRITGIHPQVVTEQGLGEAEFMARVHAELARPGTCGAGYNSLRFDDEVTRYGLYRNFYDPYAREWQGGNSRWDLIDLLRAAYALRPDGIEWPLDEEGRVSLRLERLTLANGIEHGQAHDALSDVRATIALARLVRERQPRLYDFLYQGRGKARVAQQIQLLQPLLHVSGRFSAARHYLAVALPLAWHPSNRNALIVCDLQADPRPLLELDGETLRGRLYTRRDELGEGELPVPLKLVHINRCPVLAPLKALREEDRQRLQLDMGECERRAGLLCDSLPQWQSKLAEVFAGEEFAPLSDPEQQLYSGFLGERDRRLCERVRQSSPEQLARDTWAFADERLPELLFRYRARNFPETLSKLEVQRWHEFCRQRLRRQDMGAPNTLDSFEVAMEEQWALADTQQRQVLQAWREYALNLRERYAE
ncbi:exodeoxyribonuclease I [Pseudomonas sp. CAU 1711]|uniref:exodeoxyribonuclease I n=1 Tax=Pseudomonas sp. CAU 1711 TaxID=3140356 RepID=UPI00325FE76A